MINKLISLAILTFFLLIGHSYSETQFLYPKKKPSIFKPIDKIGDKKIQSNLPQKKPIIQNDKTQEKQVLEKEKIIEKIHWVMSDHKKHYPNISKLTNFLKEEYFSCNNLKKIIKSYKGISKEEKYSDK